MGLPLVLGCPATLGLVSRADNEVQRGTKGCLGGSYQLCLS